MQREMTKGWKIFAQFCKTEVQFLNIVSFCKMLGVSLSIFLYFQVFFPCHFIFIRIPFLRSISSIKFYGTSSIACHSFIFIFHLSSQWVKTIDIALESYNMRFMSFRILFDVFLLYKRRFYYGMSKIEILEFMKNYKIKVRILRI